jgi:hypothetical protein
MLLVSYWCNDVFPFLQWTCIKVDVDRMKKVKVACLCCPYLLIQSNYYQACVNLSFYVRFFVPKLLYNTWNGLYEFCL